MPITVDTSAITSYKPQSTSLSEMLGIASKALEYEKMSELYPEYIRKTKAEAQSAEQGAEKGRMEVANIVASKIHQGQIALINNPLVIAAERGEQVDPAKLEELVIHNARVQAKNAGIPEDKAMELVKPYLDIAINNPKGLRQYGKDRLMAGLDTGTQLSATTPSMGTLGGQPALINPVTGEATTLKMPGQPAAPVGGQPTGIQPTGVQPADMGKPKSEQPALVDVSKPSPLKYPVRQAGVPFAPGVSEAKDTDVGIAYRTNLVNRQTDLPVVKRNLDEAEKTVIELEKDWLPSTGIGGKVTRGVTGFLGTETGIKYKQLSKDLANIQLANLQAQGGSMQTDAAKQLQSMANGDVTYPPSVLRNIIRRARADVTNLDLQATAAEKWAAKNGDNNMASFRQDWAKNADTRIFETMNINDSNLSDDEKKKLVSELYKNEKDRKEAAIKWRNLKKMIDTGSL